MSKFSEDTYNSWRQPPSDSEERKLVNAENAIRNAISSSLILARLPIEVYGQGSYANDTNVRLNSDIDINVRLTSPVYFDIPLGKTAQEYGYRPTTYTFEEYKQSLVNALGGFFGYESIKREDKCIRVLGNTYRNPADVVPTFKYNSHQADGTTIIGAKFISDAGREVLNFSLQHVQNGKTKNSQTQKRFKRLTRILKRVRNKMGEDGYFKNYNITSFLIECLLYNVQDSVYNIQTSWEERLRECLIYLYNNTAEENNCKDWLEVSQHLPLFYQGRKWTIKEVNDFIMKVWDYLELT